MTLNQFIKKFQIVTGVIVGISASLGSLYVAHKTFFLSDVKAEFDQEYVNFEVFQAWQTNITEMRDDIKEIRKDVKDLIKSRR